MTRLTEYECYNMDCRRCAMYVHGMCRNNMGYEIYNGHRHQQVVIIPQP